MRLVFALACVEERRAGVAPLLLSEDAPHLACGVVRGRLETPEIGEIPAQFAGSQLLLYDPPNGPVTRSERDKGIVPGVQAIEQPGAFSLGDSANSLVSRLFRIRWSVTDK